jgi:hypothetical protein
LRKLSVLAAAVGIKAEEKTTEGAKNIHRELS